MSHVELLVIFELCTKSRLRAEKAVVQGIWPGGPLVTPTATQSGGIELWRTCSVGLVGLSLVVLMAITVDCVTD